MFMGTYDGKLEPGYLPTDERTSTPGWKHRTYTARGMTFYDHPQPWALRCDTCDRVFPYGVTMSRDSLKALVPPQVREILGSAVHRCAFCEGYVEQLRLFEPAP
jgi:hypothetical protein